MQARSQGRIRASFCLIGERQRRRKAKQEAQKDCRKATRQSFATTASEPRDWVRSLIDIFNV